MSTKSINLINVILPHHSICSKIKCEVIHFSQSKSITVFFFYHIIIFFWIFLSLIFFFFFSVFFIWSYSFPFTFVSFEKHIILIILNFELFFSIFMRSNNSSLLSTESQSFSPSSLGCIFCSEPYLNISQQIQLHMWPRYFQDSFYPCPVCSQ